MSAEDRLRRALNDGDWSLPVWAAPPTQLRRAARRRMALATVAAVAAVAAVTAGIVVPLSLAGGNVTAPIANDQGNINNTKPPLPGANDPQFPASIYPTPTTAARGGYPQCPSLVGIGPRPSLNPAAYVGIVSDFGTPSFTNDLRRADRSLWPDILAADENPPVPALRQEMPSAGDPSRGITVVPAIDDDASGGAIHDCGRAIVERSVALRIGPNPAMDPPEYDVWVLQRHGRLLIWGRDPSIWANGSFLAYRNQRRYMYPQALSPCASGNDVLSEPNSMVPTTSVRFTVPHRPLSEPCSLVGWPAVRLITATADGISVRPQDVGPDTPVIMRSGQDASFVVTAKKCSGPHRTYVDVKWGGTLLAVTMPVGRCGATVSSYRLN
jgi:hypothetical protein